MTRFSRIDPNHPLAVAAREINEVADRQGGDHALELVGLGLPLEQLFYMAQQRALRGLAAIKMGYVMGNDEDRDNAVAIMVQLDPDFEEISTLLVAMWVDGCSTGWHGHRLSEAEATA